MRLIRSLRRLGLSLVVFVVLRPGAWWQARRVRRAARDFRRASRWVPRDLRRADYYAVRGVRTLVAVGCFPIPRTVSGVPAMPPLRLR